MARNDTHIWNPDFPDTSPLFNPVRELAYKLTIEHPITWPDLDDYQYLLETETSKLCSQHGAPIRFVAQGDKASCFENNYEPRIYLKGEVQTRTQNWHDFFQVLVWAQFPRTKAQLNTLHYHAAHKRCTAIPPQPNRSPIENTITLFDECGIIITSSDPSLLDLIRNHQWKELFWQQRAELETKLHCIIFGHALYEKALQPYIGMTGHALLLTVNDSFHQLTRTQQCHQLDKRICDQLETCAPDMSPQMLTPFPLLGMPGWHTENDQAAFYDNTKYFRDKRKKSIHSNN